MHKKAYDHCFLSSDYANRDPNFIKFQYGPALNYSMFKKIVLPYH